MNETSRPVSILAAVLRHGKPPKETQLVDVSLQKYIKNMRIKAQMHLPPLPLAFN